MSAHIIYVCYVYVNVPIKGSFHLPWEWGAAFTFKKMREILVFLDAAIEGGRHTNDFLISQVTQHTYELSRRLGMCTVHVRLE